MFRTRTHKQPSHNHTSRPFFSKGLQAREAAPFFSAQNSRPVATVQPKREVEDHQELEEVQTKAHDTDLESPQYSAGEAPLPPSDPNSKPTIQTKLTIGQPNDRYEQEADLMADKVMRSQDSPSPPSISALNGSISTQFPFHHQMAPIQRKSLEYEEKEILQTQRLTSTTPANSPMALNGIEQLIDSSKGSGSAMDSKLRIGMERKMHTDFSDIKIHDNSASHHMNRSLGARAFTYKNNIYFNQGEYNPSSQEGQRLLAHELTHTIQQRGGIQTHRIQRATVPNVVSALNAAIAASDKPAYMDVLRGENAAHAENSTIYMAIQGHQAASAISVNEAWQAVCILNYGNDTNRPHPWPVTIRNFFEGIILGEYTVPGIAPRLKDDILQLAVSIAHTEITTSIGSSGGGRGMGSFMDYMGKFNALWGTSTFSGMSSDFDRTLSSKGPKTERSRAIFNHLYTTDPLVRSDYDNNVTGVNTGTEGMRELVDQYVGPESRNLIASPRIQRLREEFYNQSLIASNNLANAAYVAFKGNIRPFAEALNETDRQEIENSHQWRSIIDWTVTGTALRQDLARYLQTAYLSAAAPASTNVIVGVGTNIPGTAATSTTGPAPVTAPPPALTADQQNFVDNMTLHATSLAITSENDVTVMDLFGRSTRDEAGLTLRTRVVINNPANHRGGTGDTILAWPSASAQGATHRPRVTTGTGRGTTTYTATLTLEHPDGTPIARTGGAAIAPLTIIITDNRYGAFVTHMTDHLFKFYVGGESNWYSPGNTVNYYGGQAPLDVEPHFNRVPATGNFFSLPPDLVVYSEANVTQNGASIPGASFGPTEFPADAESLFLGRIIAIGPTAPPAPDAMVVTVRFREASSSGPIFHTRTEAFNINQSVAAAAGTPMAAQLAALRAQLTADKTALNTRTPPPLAVPSGWGTIIDEMIHHGTLQTARIAQTILAGTITLEPMIIRPDSEAFLSAQVAAGHNRWGRVPTSHVIFALKDAPLDTAPMANPPNTLEESPSVNAVKWMNQIFVHLTTSLGPPPVRRTNFSSIIRTIVHEAVHLVDIRPHSGTEIERYRTEFRAYWMDGRRDHLSTAFNPSMNNFGPKSEKARTIFNHLYNSSTYAFVKTAYDANTNGFRDQVNAYVTPEGINLIVSQRLEEIRSAIAGFGTTYGPAERTRINDLYNGNAAAGIAPATADDRREISGNRAWRELVESKGFSATDLTDIKNDLHIPI